MCVISVCVVSFDQLLCLVFPCTLFVNFVFILSLDHHPSLSTFHLSLSLPLPLPLSSPSPPLFPQYVMRNTTHCLSRVIYEIDLEQLPLKQLSEIFSHRPRTRTTGSAGEWSRKKSFSEYRPLPPSHAHSTADLSISESVSSARKLAKASTYELTTASSASSLTPPTSSLDKSRRSSSPAVSKRGGASNEGEVAMVTSSLSSGGVGKRINEEIKEEDTKGEEEEGGGGGGGGGGSVVTTPPNILSGSSSPVEATGSVIINAHTALSPEPSDHTPSSDQPDHTPSLDQPDHTQQSVAINVTTPTGTKNILDNNDDDDDSVDDHTHQASLVISNEDVSSESGDHTPDHTLQDDDKPVPLSSSPISLEAPLTQATPLQTHPLLKRSNSDSYNVRPILKRQDHHRSISRSRSPDLRYLAERDHSSSDHTHSRVSQSPYSDTSFTQYIPGQSSQTTPTTWLASHTPSSSTVTHGK